eukprot:7343365-Pyramimonas_sp.AAC.1
MTDKGRVISASELAQHATQGDLWVAVDGNVMDLTRFAKMHPGGVHALLSTAGRDATREFYALHRSEVILQRRTCRRGLV